MLKLLHLVLTVVALSLSATARAEPIVLDVLHVLPAQNPMYEQVSAAFTKLHPDIVISYRASPPNYDEAHQTLLRSSITNKLPDVYFASYSTLPDAVRQLQKRSQIIDLRRFIDKEPSGWLAANFAPNVIEMGRVDGAQYGIPFNASGPIFFYNADLVRKAGGDPDRFPQTWDGVIALAQKIHQAEPDADGMAYDVHNWPEDWVWQALLKQQGGDIVAPDKRAVTFDDGRALAALKLARRFVTDGAMKLRDQQQSRQQFAAGRTGMIILSTNNVATYGALVGNRFELRTGAFPIASPNGTLPTGGNAAIIMSKDVARQQAAWEFIKFATGPEGQTIAAKASGYLPTNKRAFEDQYLGEFYKTHPEWATSAKQLGRYSLWSSYPGGRGVEIWRMQRDIIGLVMRGDVTPEDGAARLIKETNALMNAS